MVAARSLFAFWKNVLKLASVLSPRGLALQSRHGNSKTPVEKNYFVDDADGGTVVDG